MILFYYIFYFTMLVYLILFLLCYKEIAGIFYDGVLVQSEEVVLELGIQTLAAGKLKYVQIRTKIGQWENDPDPSTAILSSSVVF